MARMSPHFSFMEYWSYTVDDTGRIGQPFSTALDPTTAHDKFVYVFGEAAGGGAPWRCDAFYRLEALSTTEPPTLYPAVGSAQDGSAIWGEAVPTIQLPQEVDAGVRNRKYYFLISRWVLTEATVRRLEQGKPAHLPVVELLAEGPHLRYVRPGPRGLQVTDAGDPGGVRVAIAVDPHTVGEHLADSLEHAINRVLKFTLPEAADNEQERIDAERRGRLAVLAQQIDALRTAGLDLSEKLEAGTNGGTLLDEFLADLDPRGDGEHARRIRQRERFARGILAWTQSDLWNLLDSDARETPSRALDNYERHLNSAARCLERLAESDAGAAYLERLYAANLAGRAQRPAPADSNEFVVQEFLFVEEHTASTWTTSVALNSGRRLFTLHLNASKVMASYALAQLSDYVSFRPDAGLRAWARGPLDSAAGLTAYRWAYYLRNTYLLETLELTGTLQRVAWIDHGGRQSMHVLQLDIDWDNGEWQSRLGANTPRVAVLGTALNVVWSVFCTLALAEAIEQRRDPALPALKASAAYASLASSVWVSRLFARLGEAAGETSGLRAARWLGAMGSGLVVFTSGWDARNAWVNDGEGDVALAHSASAVGAVLATWAAVGATGFVMGPPGWVVVTGYSLLVLGALAAVWLRDDPIEDMVEHSYFGPQRGQGHNAPPVALCADRKFSAWAGIDPAALDAQIRGFENFTWGFVVQGDRLVADQVGPVLVTHPLVTLRPQRLTSGSCFDVEVEMSWGTLGNRRELTAHGMVRLHVGDRDLLRVEALTGDPFEATSVPHDGVNLAVLSRGFRDGRHVIDWIVAPDAAFRARIGNRHLTVARLALRLDALGTTSIEYRGQRTAPLLIPVPEPPITEMFLEYPLVRLPPNAQTLVGRINRDALSSMEAYRP